MSFRCLWKAVGVVEFGHFSFFKFAGSLLAFGAGQFFILQDSFSALEHSEEHPTWLSLYFQMSPAKNHMHYVEVAVVWVLNMVLDMVLCFFAWAVLKP
jgi:hypothetical protein